MSLSQKKQRVTVVMDKDLWDRVKVVSSQVGMSASAFVQFVTYSYVSQHEKMMDKFLNMTPEELAQYTAFFKKFGGDADGK